MDEQLRELFKKAFNEGAMYEATLSNAYSFDSFIKENIEQLRQYFVSGSVCDFCKGEGSMWDGEFRDCDACKGSGKKTEL